jgi:hypothetical protein
MDGTAAFKKYLAQSWWVPGGISALGDRNTFMAARKRKNKRAGEMSQPGRENYENTNYLINTHKSNRFRQKLARLLASAARFTA